MTHIQKDEQYDQDLNYSLPGTKDSVMATLNQGSNVQAMEVVITGNANCFSGPQEAESSVVVDSELCRREESNIIVDSDMDQGNKDIIVVQSGSDLILEGSDSTLLKCVRSLLAGGAEQSLMIVGKDGVQKRVSLTSEIHQSEVNAVSESLESLSYSVNLPSSSLDPQIMLSSTPALPVFSTVSNASAASVPSSTTSASTDSKSKDVLYTTKPSSDLFQEIPIKTKSHPVHSRLPADISKYSSISSANSTSIVNESIHEVSMAQKNLESSQTVSQIETSASASRGKTFGTDSRKLPAAEHLLTIAKKMIQEKAIEKAKKLIEEKGIIKPLSAADKMGESSTSSDVMEVKTSQCSDSIITMYLSSPDELKGKLEKLKTNSPVIVMQAGEDLLVGNKEAGDRDQSSGGSSDETLCTDLPSKGKQSSGSTSDGLVAALSTLSSNPTVYRCVECGYSSHNKHYYKQHVDLVHNADRPYKCPHCDYAGKRRHALLEHMVVHSNQRPFTCDHCNASFRKKGHLTNHIKLHTSQRLVHCGVCNIQLPDTEAFEAHLRKIHNTDKLYKCKLCDHTVVDRESMLTHLQTHNEAIVYSCPKCPNLYNNEESLVAHMKSSHDFVFVEGSSSVKQVTPSSSSDANVVKQDGVATSQPTNIMCSECGFVCSKPAAMKKHMWVHIKKESDGATVHPSEKSGGQAECGATLGVLKMNVNKGQRSLPKNVTYQCSSCCFSSSDNSVFIKHMLAHKTQKKQQNITLTSLVKNAKSFVGIENSKQGSASGIHIQQEPSQANPLSLTEVKYSADSSVPFVYDKAAGRYRCVICGYHCEFQRTIKAHIWKHSGHQNIQYPVFELSAKTGSSTVTTNNQKVNEEYCGEPNEPQQAVIIGQPQNQEAEELMQKAVEKPESDATVLHLLPSDATSGSQSNKQVRVSSLTMSTDNNTPASVEKLPELLAYAEVVDVKGHGCKPVETSLDMHGLEKTENAPNADDVKQEICDSDPVKAIDASEGCTEPGVVVEIVDSVPSSLGLTGMKSQQGSPRVLDLDGSGSEAALLKGFQTYSQQQSKKSAALLRTEEIKEELQDQTQTTESTKTRKPTIKQEDFHGTSGKEQAVSVRLRCPSCDCVLMSKEELRSHLLLCQGAVGKDSSFSPKSSTQKAKPTSIKTLSDQEDMDTLATEDSDATESSDEQTGLGDVGAGGNQQKTGICSSLLAVIEQLRERSQSESDDTKTGLKGGRRRTRQSGDTSPLSADDFQNIEKIRENGSEKFRCSLCHYTSQRICNMKLHMKTHRQKKPSECSLCDFSSSSPEALQEHMLKHCKVRTYACKFCPQSFNHKSTLRAHLRAHKDHEPFLCAYCVFETSNPMEYREHMQVHSGCSSRLRCPLCDSIFGNKEELTSHLLKCKGSCKKTESVSDVKTPHKEKEVDKVQSDPGVSTPATTLTQHTCVVSGCSFSSSNLKELQDHLSVHCNPSLLVCNLCDFKALHSRSLKSHMKRHANDQRYVQQPLEQYKCNLCGYVCHHLPSLKSHMWRHASDQSYSYEFTNDVINAAIDHDTRLDSDSTEVDDPELLDRVINSERKILEGELTKSSRGDGQRPICWVTFRCCSCGFETINKAKLNIHMRSHSDLIQQALDVPRKSGGQIKPSAAVKAGEKRALAESDNTSPYVYVKARKT